MESSWLTHVEYPIRNQLNFIELRFRELNDRLNQQMKKCDREELRNLLLQAEVDLLKDTLREKTLELRRKDEIIDNQLLQLIRAWEAASDPPTVQMGPAQNDNPNVDDETGQRDTRKRKFEECHV